MCITFLEDGVFLFPKWKFSEVFRISFIYMYIYIKSKRTSKNKSRNLFFFLSSCLRFVKVQRLEIF